MADSTYSAGTISLAAGGLAVAGELTAFLSQVKPGDTLIHGAAVAVIETISSNTALTLEMAWPGSMLTDEADYLILRTGMGWKSATEINARLVEIIAELEAGADAFATAEQGTKADAALPRDGGEMTGKITLDGDPASSLHAAPKQYVDTAVAGLMPYVDAAVAGLMPSATTSVYPVKTVATMVKRGAGSLADGATISGANVQSAFWDATGIMDNSGTAQLGTWKNISGVTLLENYAGRMVRIS
jgi:hypothetical protein